MDPKTKIDRDRDRLELIQEHCLSAMEHVEVFERISKMDIAPSDRLSLSKMSYDGTLMRLSQIGEEASRLTPAFRDASGHEIQWDQIRALRNIIVHDYHNVDHDLIVKIVKEDLDPLLDFCAKELGLDDPSPDRGAPGR